MNMHFDHAAEFLEKGTVFMNIIKNHSINWNVTEPYTHWHNWSEDDIKLIKILRKSTI